MLNDLPLKHSLSRMDDCPSIWGESIKWRHIKMWHMLIWSVICVIVVNLLQSIVGCQVYEKQKLMSPRARNSPVSCRQKRISLNRSTRLEVLVNRVLAVKSDLDLIDHLRSGIVYNFNRFYLSVCLYVCLSDDNFEKTWRRKFIFAHLVYLQAVRSLSYMKVVSLSYMKVVRSKSLSQEQSQQCLFMQRKTACQGNSPSLQIENLIANNSASGTHRVVKSVYSV